MTIGYIICIVVVGLGIFGIGSWYVYCNDHGFVGYIVAFIIALAVVGVMCTGGLWYFNNTAMGVRALKDEASNLSNGLLREITITAEDGREIFHYVGRCDIETNESYILFEGEDGLRRMIYYGRLDTIIIEELPEK